MIVSAGNAKFGIPEVKRGLVAGAGGLLKLPRQIPRRVAMELALTGDAIDVRTAFPKDLRALLKRLDLPRPDLDDARAAEPATGSADGADEFGGDAVGEEETGLGQ